MTTLFETTISLLTDSQLEDNLEEAHFDLPSPPELPSEAP
jgi:hypothetical protein